VDAIPGVHTITSDKIIASKHSSAGRQSIILVIDRTIASSHQHKLIEAAAIIGAGYISVLSSDKVVGCCVDDLTAQPSASFIAYSVCTHKSYIGAAPIASIVWAEQLTGQRLAKMAVKLAR
jgi:hypothetical protein